MIFLKYYETPEKDAYTSELYTLNVLSILSKEDDSWNDAWMLF